MSRAIVYLCGAITGDPETYSWRDDVTRELDYMYDIATLNPLRGKNLESITGWGYTSNIPSGLFVTRDLTDIKNADALICNFLVIPDRQMIGSLMEIGMAYTLGKPFVVAAMDPMFTEHPFIQHTALDIVPTLEDAVETIGIIFSGGLSSTTWT